MILQNESEIILSCAFEVLNTLGCGLIEKPYENALVVEFSLRNIPFRQQIGFDVYYKGQQVGRYIPDLIVFDQIIVDVKTIDSITNHEVAQILNYLHITKMKLGLILNFKHSKLEWKRIVL